MARATTRFSRVSIGWDSSTKSLVDADPADTGPVFSVTGDTVFSTFSISGAQTFDGAARFNSTVTVGGNLTASSGAFVGDASAINEVVAISSVTRAISLGAIAPLESSSVQTFAMSGLTRGDTLVFTVDPIYPIVAANRDVTWMASSSSTAGEGHVWGVNSTLTSVTPTASTVVRFTRINHPSYI